jgi:sulfatase modifying factor 1
MQLSRFVSVSVVLSSLTGSLTACAGSPATAEPKVPASPSSSAAPVVSATPTSTNTPSVPATTPAPAVNAPSTPPLRPDGKPAAAAAAPSELPKNAKEIGADETCPAGMVLVEGDYCTSVKHDCRVEWYAPQNKKVVCEQFEPKATCVGEKVRKRYCIDRYEWPNQKGVRPEVMNTFYQAQVKCAALGRRMCTESEWTFACEGPEMKPFPYGFTRDPKRCNGDHQWDGPVMTKVAKRDAKELARLWRGVPSGTQGCVSDFGVEDLPGNADEVCAGETPSAKYASVNTGGPWYSGVRNQCRPKVYTHGEDFYYYFLSFRCCANPNGAANEFRTSKQIKDETPWKDIERLAGFTVEQMKAALELKKQGKCTCEGRMLDGKKIGGPAFTCKTMCGTLLGPDAKDATDETRVLHQERRKLD